MPDIPPVPPPHGSRPPAPEASAELRARVPKLLEAIRSVGGGLEPHATLQRICETAADLAGARYAALGVVAEDGQGLADFVHHGVDEATAHRTGQPPDPRTGLLGAVTEGPPSRGFLGVPVRVQGEIFGNLYLAGKRGGESFDDHDLALVRVLATEAGIAIGNARLYESARARERWIDGSVAVTTALLSGAGPEASLRVVAEQARRLSGAVAGLVLLPVAGGGMEIAAVAGRGPTETPGTVLPPDSGLVAGLLAGRAMVVHDAATDPRLTTGLHPVTDPRQDADPRLTTGPHQATGPHLTTDPRQATGLARAYGPALVLPLRSGGRVLGGLVMPRARGERPFTRTERALADRFAAQAALALVMEEAQRDRERIAVYEDRDRIARDLHDLVIQRLFATGMTLENAERASAVPEVRDGVRRAVDELDVTIQEIRSAVFALRRSAEAPSELRTRVLREITMAAAPLGHTPAHRFVGPIDGAVGEATGRNLLAALREALSNAYRHARAARTEVVVDATATLPDGRPGVRLTVADDGVGLPEGGRRSGLHNLVRRAQALGGTSRTGPGIGADGSGTTVVWEAPL